MPKDAFYFQHDYNARNDDKILELRSQFGAEGYGVFWMIIETMAENDDGGLKASLIGGLSLGYGVAKGWLSEFITACVSIGLFYEKDGYYFSKRLLTHKEFRQYLSEKGKEGAAKKWGGYRGANGHPYAKERKGKEINKRGVAFDEKNENVIFEDGSVQPLGSSQKIRLLHNDLKPKDVILGSIS